MLFTEDFLFQVLKDLKTFVRNHTASKGDRGV